jgi:hypothetical protein
MKKDIEIPEVHGVYIAAVLELNENQQESWMIYLINDLGVMIEGVMITSKGHEDMEGKILRTASMRHRIGNVPYKTAIKVELIDAQVFEIFNEYWVTFFQEGKVMEKKFTFGPHTIDKAFLEDLPVMNQKGVIVK